MPHFYEGSRKSSRGNRRCVSMPSRAYASFLLHCQKQTLVLDLDPCQCPHGLVPHFYRQPLSSVVSGQVIVSMPSRASTSFLHQFQRSIKECYSVSMPSRASTSFLQYPFKNLGFMRFPEPVFAGICQNILAVAHFHAC